MKQLNRRGILLLAAAALLLAISATGTLAYLTAASGPVEHEFTAAIVSTGVEETYARDGSTTAVRIRNTGTVAVFLRVKLIGNYIDDVTGQVVASSQITLAAPGAGWVLKADGCYYHTAPVAIGGVTGNLLENSAIIPDMAAYPGTHLEITVLHQAIQAEGMNPDGKPAVEDAWGVTLDADGYIR